VLVVNLVDSADVRMIQCGYGLRLSFEAGKSLRILRNLVWQEPEGNKTMQLYVLAVWAAAAVESDSTRYREAKECSWIENPSTDENSFPIPAIVRSGFC
jgi:hypothetical protein